MGSLACRGRKEESDQQKLIDSFTFGRYDGKDFDVHGVLRRHLYEHHVDAWVESCDQLKIPIKAKEAAKSVDEYRVRKGQKTGSALNS